MNRRLIVYLMWCEEILIGKTRQASWQAFNIVLQDDHATTHTTIEDALSHRSGVPRHDLAWGQPDSSPSSVTKILRYLPMTAEPRTTFQYCNIMYAVVTGLLEKLTGLKLETILRQNFWEPLGMASTSFGGFNVQNKLARGYYWNPDSSATESLLSRQPLRPRTLPESLCYYWRWCHDLLRKRLCTLG